MADNDHLDPPEQSIWDDIHMAAKATLSSVIPITGGAVAEIFAALVVPPIEKRRDAWMQTVAEMLRQLVAEKGLTLESLQANDAFITFVLQTTTVAIRNHQEEKRQALRNCLYNAAGSPDGKADLHLSFIRFVDELSPSHVLLLRLVRDRHGEIAVLKSYETLYSLLAPELPRVQSQDIFKMMCLDLGSRGLVQISADIEDLPGIYEASAILWESTRDDLPRLVISAVGNEFLSFISSSD
jgi:hypothetical protein